MKNLKVGKKKKKNINAKIVFKKLTQNYWAANILCFKDRM